MELFVMGFHQPGLANGFHIRPGAFPVAVSVKWEYEGSGSATPDADQLYLIGSDHLVASHMIDSQGGLPECADYEMPEMATGAIFGPKPVCFLLAVPAGLGLTLRWKHGLFGGSDQDLVLV